MCISEKFNYFFGNMILLHYICKQDVINLEKYSFNSMKFREGDNLTWKLFLEACKEVDNANSIITESIDSHLSFSSIMSTRAPYSKMPDSFARKDGFSLKTAC